MSDSLQPHELQHTSFLVPHCLLKFGQTHVHWVSNAIQPFLPRSLPSPLTLIFPRIIVFPSESTLLIRWPKNWNFRISPSNEVLGLNISYSSAYKMLCEVKSLSHVRLFATPWTIVYQNPPSMGFSRQECWSGLPFPSPGDLPDPGIEPGSPALQADAFPSEPPGKPKML